MRFRLRFESLETRDNPSGPELLDPTPPGVPPTAAIITPADVAAANAAVTATIAATAGFVNPLALWGI